jgi:ERCC4-type nuclease
MEPKAAVDTYEPEALRKRCQILVPQATIQPLHSGDFAVWDGLGESVGIERKKVRDLLGSMAKKHVGGRKYEGGGQRLTDQLEALVKDYDTPILLVEGIWGVTLDGYVWVGALGKDGKVLKTPVGWHYSSVAMQITSVPVQLYWTQSWIETAEYFSALWTRANRAKGLNLKGRVG